MKSIVSVPRMCGIPVSVSRIPVNGHFELSVPFRVPLVSWTGKRKRA